MTEVQPLLSLVVTVHSSLYSLSIFTSPKYTKKLGMVGNVIPPDEISIGTKTFSIFFKAMSLHLQQLHFLHSIEFFLNYQHHKVGIFPFILFVNVIVVKHKFGGNTIESY